jgi:hypothetical protein
MAHILNLCLYSIWCGIRVSFSLGRLMENWSLSRWRKDRYHLYDQHESRGLLHCCISFITRFFNYCSLCIRGAVRSILIAEELQTLPQSQFSIAAHRNRHPHIENNGDHFISSSSKVKYLQCPLQSVVHARLISRSSRD